MKAYDLEIEAIVGDEAFRYRETIITDDFDNLGEEVEFYMKEAYPNVKYIKLEVLSSKKARNVFIGKFAR